MPDNTTQTTQEKPKQKKDNSEYFQEVESKFRDLLVALGTHGEYKFSSEQDSKIESSIKAVKNWRIKFLKAEEF